MSDTPDTSSLLSNSPERSVSELSTELKRLVEDAFGQVRLRGEISGYRGPHSSGHMYFTLKDERASIDAVVWRGVASKLKFPPEEGMEVSVTGKVTTYPGRSKYQIVIETLEPAGVGALMALLEERRRKLTAEGLFDDANKRPLPFMPGVIGVVTSPTGSVIRDIIHRIKDRFAVHVIVWPVRVQGDSSAQEVSAAIAGFNALSQQDPIPRPDLIIVARGGGSLEDLWGFNEEAVVRAAADSTIPIISAVGHETDWTLLDHVADRRAPTPTGAAEMAVPVRADLEAALAALVARHAGGLLRHLERQRTALRSMARGLPSADTLLALPRRRFDEAASANGRALLASVGRKRDHFSRQAGQLSFAALTGRFAAARERTLRLGQGTDRAISRRLLDNRRQLTLVERRLDGGPARLDAKRSQLADRTGTLENRLERAFGRQGERVIQRLGEADRLLQSLSHRRVLERGFALVRKQDRQPVTRAKSLAPGETITVEFADGAVGAVTKSGGKPVQPKRQDGDGSAKQQGLLF